MNTNTTISNEQFNTLDTHGWELHKDVEGFSVTRTTEDNTTEQIVISYRDDGEHCIEVIQNGHSHNFGWAPDDGCLQFVEHYTAENPAPNTDTEQRTTHKIKTLDD